MSNKNKIEIEEQNFSLSISDLMSAMLFIFILLLSSTMLQLKEKEEKLAQVSENYEDVKQSIVIGLNSEFGNDFKKWSVDPVDSTLCVRFQKESTNFARNSDELKDEFKGILKDFFPRYIDLVYNNEDIRRHIKEIRIEGHTSSDGEYFPNMDLSQRRTQTVLKYCYELIEDAETQEWIKKKITANGLSYSHLIYKEDGSTEDMEKSRRVEFVIVTDAEVQMESIKDQLLGN